MRWKASCYINTGSPCIHCRKHAQDVTIDSKVSGLVGRIIASCNAKNIAKTIAKIVAVCLLCVLSSVCSTAAYAEGNAEKTSAAAARERNQAIEAVANYRNDIQRLQQGIQEQESKINESEDQERSILNDIEELEQKLEGHQQRIVDLSAKMVKQQALIDRETKAMEKVRDERDVVEAHLKKRISAYYTMGDIGLLNVTFSTQTLPELLRFHDAFDTLIKYDQDVIRVYHNTIDELEKSRKTLALERAVLKNFIEENVRESTLLGKAKADKEQLLVQVRTQAKLHEKARTEMQQASDELVRSIVTIKKRSQVYENSFEADKGSLPPPVDGMLVTLFQQEKVNKLGISKLSQGIELQAPDNTAVVAVCDGEVIFSGYLRGYGKTVIIHHGFQYYTVTSRLEKIFVKKGQKVRREEKIGIMGATATLFDEGLYFEIRRDKQSLDPLLWLNPNRLSNPNEERSLQEIKQLDLSGQ